VVDSRRWKTKLAMSKRKLCAVGQRLALKRRIVVTCRNLNRTDEPYSEYYGVVVLLVSKNHNNVANMASGQNFILFLR
jgi:hypothetical protein